MSETKKHSGISLVFLGSGPVAAESLKILLNYFDIEAVITKPSTLYMMQRISPSLAVYTVENKKELEDLVFNNKFTSKVGVVVDFGIIISKKVIEYFEHGIVNSHFSLLPRWRGADPISYSILKGDNKTGVSLMVIDEGLDTGKLITYKSIKLDKSYTTSMLTNELVVLSGRLLAEYLPKYLAGEVKPKSQPHPDRATYSRKLKKSDGILDWSKSAIDLDREIRAYLDWPKSRTELGNKDIVVTKAHVYDGTVKLGPGDIHTDSKLGELLVGTSDGILALDCVKPAGKNEMPVKAFLAGYGTSLKNKN